MALSPMQVLRLLPGNNCRNCEEEFCLAFALALVNKKTTLDKCPLLRTAKYDERRSKLEDAFGKVEKIDFINLDKCLGCGNCVVSCPANALLSRSISGGKGASLNNVVLRVIGGKLMILNLDKCKRFLPGGAPCGICSEVCPRGAVEWLAKLPSRR